MKKKISTHPVKIRVLSGLMAVSTIASPVMSYAADLTLPAVTTDDTETTHVSTETGDSEISTIKYDNYLLLDMKAAKDGGAVIINEGKEDEKTIRVETIGEKSYISVYDKDGVLTEDGDAEKNDYMYTLAAEADTILSVKVTADAGYKISKYELSCQGEPENTSFTGQIDDFTEPVYMDNSKTLTVGFEEKWPETETELQTEVQTETPETLATSDLTVTAPQTEPETEPVTEATDLTVKETEKETESASLPETELETTSPETEATTEAESETVSPETEAVTEPETVSQETEAATESETTSPETTTESETADTETEAPDLTVRETEMTESESETETQEPETEITSETETKETEHFLDEAFGVETLNQSDFETARLVVMTEDEAVIIDKEHLVGSYGNLYLLQYGSVDQAMNAYMYYLAHAEAVEPDAEMEAAAELESETEWETAESETESTSETTGETTPAADNALMALNAEADSIPAQTESHVIALIDTGASDGPNIIDRVSLIDDVLVGGDHGDKMVDAIVSQNPDAKILSIRTIGDDGKGQVSSVVAGMEYAINQKVDIINLSMYAKRSLSNTVIASEIQKAVDAGIEVVGAAGNDGRDVKYYMPGSVECAWIIGACDEEGNRIESSNYGQTVDYNVVAGSTSEAAAKFSGYLSLNGKENLPGDNGLIFETNQEGDADNNQLYIASTLVVKVGSEFHPEEYFDDLTSLVPEGAEIALSYSDLNINEVGKYVTIYRVKAGEKEYAIKRPVVVTEDGEMTDGQYMLEFFTTTDDSVNLDVDSAYYNAGDVVEFSVSPKNGAKIDSIRAYEQLNIPNSNEILGDELVVEQVTADGQDAAEESAYVDKNALHYRFVMPASDVYISIITDGDIMETAAPSGLGNFDISSGGMLYYYNASIMSSGKKGRGTRHRVVTYWYKDTSGNTVRKVVNCYCIQPKLTAPDEGTFGPERAESLKDSSLISKALYYLYEGPMWNTTIKVGDKYVNMKKVLDTYPNNTTDANSKNTYTYYALTHFILGYMYCGGPAHADLWNYEDDGISGTVFNQAGIDWLYQLKLLLMDMPAPTTTIKQGNNVVEGKTIDASSFTLRKTDNKLVSPTLTCSTFESNKTQFYNLPEGYSIEWSSQGKTGTFTKDIAQSSRWLSGGATFKLVVDPKKTSDTSFTLKMNTKYPTDFEGYKIKTLGKQDLGFAYYSDNDAMTVKFNIPEVTTRLKVRKYTSSGKWNDKLKGAEFSLYEGSSYKAKVTINSNAAYEFNYDCKLGHTYTIKETKAPAGFSKAGNQEITLHRAQYEPAKILTFYDGILPPYVYVTKISTASSEMLGLSGYSLSGAEFTVYSNAACTQVVGTVKTGSDGKSNQLKLPCSTEGTYNYYVKETKAPSGHQINPSVSQFSVTLPDDAGQVKNVNFWDAPDAMNIGAFVQKTDNNNKPVPGAIFKVCLYDGVYNSVGACPAGQLKKTWYLQSNAKGEVAVNENYLANSYHASDSFYTFNNNVVVPVNCTLTYQEVAAPAGYILDNTVQLWSVNGQTVQMKKMYNNIYPPYVKVTKISTASAEMLGLSGYSLAGGEFTVYSDAACTQSVGKVTTDGNGTSTQLQLPCNAQGTYTYYVKETKAPSGHKINQDTAHFSVTLPTDAGQVKNVNFWDDPYTIGMGAFVQKLDNRSRPVPGAIFKVCLYDGVYNSAGACPAGQLKKTWYLQSNAKGEVAVNDNYLANSYHASDSFYTFNNNIVLPINCTLTYQEVQVPAEYVLDNTVQLWSVNGQTIQMKKFYNDLKPSKIKIKKYDTDGKTPLAGVTFELKFVKASTPTNGTTATKTYTPLLKVNETTTATTNSSGYIEWGSLDQGDYEITEIKTAAGHQLLRDKIKLSLPIALTTQEAKNLSAATDLGVFDSISQKWLFFEATYEITNTATFRMPMTGGNGNWKYGFIGFGIAAMTGLIIIEETTRRKRKYRK